MSDDIIPKSSIPPDKNNINGGSYGNTLESMFVLSGRKKSSLFHNNPLVSPYYSKKRDIEMQQLVINNDYLLIALYNNLIKTSSIMPNITLKDPTNTNEADIAGVRLLNIIIDNTWVSEVMSFLYDLRTTDNGGHYELLGLNGEDSQSELLPQEISPNVFVPAVGFRHLFSERVTRTGDDTYPIIYKHTDNKDYKLHKSRVYSLAEMPTGNPLLFGVGICGISRVLRSAVQNQAIEDLLLDMLYDGMVGEIVLGHPFSDTLLRDAFQQAELRQKGDKTDKYLKSIYLTTSNPEHPAPTLQRFPLRRLPENFNKTESIENFMSLLASALGTDARELWPVRTTTKADAEVSDKKGNLKFIKWWLETQERFIQNRLLPDYAKVTFPFQDTETQKELDESRKKLAESLKIEIDSGFMIPSVAVETYKKRKYITEQMADEILETIENEKVVEADINQTPTNTLTDDVDRTNPNLFRQETTKKQLEDYYFKVSEPGTIISEVEGVTITTGDVVRALSDNPTLAKILKT